MEPWDVTIVGGGILGTSIGYWLARRYAGRIAVVERETQVAVHTSHRNTGVIHRPFYLDPVKRRVFARSSQAAYGMWKTYAADRGLPWTPVSTLEVATSEAQVSVLETYHKWGQENGMAPAELSVLSPEEVREVEPHVDCHGAIWSRTDTAVDYRAFTESLRGDAERAGAAFLTGHEVVSIDVEDDHLAVHVRRRGIPGAVGVDPRGRIPPTSPAAQATIRTRFLVNCAGGNAVDIAHMLGVGREYADLHFRGEYWTVDPRMAFLARRNIYTVARRPELPFLDPHWIVRTDGRREIGPNAVPVTGPLTYRGFFDDAADPIKKFLEPPVANKVAVLVNPDFLSLAAAEWASSLSKRMMARRVREFLPELRVSHLVSPGTAGVRASCIDRHGNFMKEAIELDGPHSHHILNYNSPGATGAPAYSAWMVANLASRGFLDHLTPKAARPDGPWDFDSVTAAVATPAS